MSDHKEKVYKFSGWSVAMAAIALGIGNEDKSIFPRAEPLKPGDLYPTDRIFKTTPRRNNQCAK